GAPHDAARDALPVHGRGAGSAGCRGATGPPAGPRRSRRLPGADPVGLDTVARLGDRRAVAPVAPGGGTLQRRGAPQRSGFDPAPLPGPADAAPVDPRAAARRAPADRGRATDGPRVRA